MLVIGDRDALVWILSEQRMAFAASRYRYIDSLMPGDRLALYATRNSFHNPTRDRGRVIGTATVTSELEELGEPVRFGDRSFGRGCTMRIERLALADEGPELAGLVDKLQTFPEAWRIHIRKTLVPLDRHDFGILDRSLGRVDHGREAALPSYLNKANARRRQGRRSA